MNNSHANETIVEMTDNEDLLSLDEYEEQGAEEAEHGQEMRRLLG